MNRLKRLAGRCLLGLVLVGMGSAGWAGEKVVLSSGVLAPYTTPDRQGFLDQLLPAVFSRLGLEAELVSYPTATERGMLNANEGIDDGLAMRIAGLEQQYPNLIRVPEPVAINDFVALSVRHHFEASSWNSLAPYSVAYIIGWKVFEKHVPKGRERTLVRDVEQLFMLLDSDRADVALYERWQGLAQARRLGLKVRAMEPPLVRTEMYIYLHKKHAALVPRVAEVLRALKRDGTYQRIHAATLEPLAR